MTAGAKLPLPGNRPEPGEPEDHRHATWLELFFDLVFVVAIAQLASALIKHPDRDGFLQFIALFVPIWWAWVGMTFYSTRFGGDGVLERLLFFAAMLGTVAMAVNVDGAIGERSAAFAAGYVAVRTTLVALYAIAARRVPEGRELSRFLAVGFSIGAAVWLASIFVPEPARYWMWAAGMAIDVLVPQVGTRILARTPIHPVHLPERFGLFMIIVLGESIVAIVAGTDSTDWDTTSVVVAGCAFAAAASLWWSYFDFSAWSTRCGLLNSERTGPLARDVYSYGHFPVAVGLTLLGAGAKLAIVDASADSLPAGARWALCGGVALYLVAITLVHAGMEGSLRSAIWWPRLLVAGVAVVLAAAGSAIAPVALSASLAAAVIVLLVLEIVQDPEGVAVWSAARD